nr:uncharacterized protein LOC110373573 [Helicoverpa armigera]
MSNCDTCGLPVKQIDKITCKNCDKIYHHLCGKLSVSAFKKLSKAARSKWNCPSCLSQHDESCPSLSEVLEDSSEGEDNRSNDIRRTIREEIRKTLRNELKDFFKDLRLEMDELRKQIDELKLSASFDISQVNDLKAELMAVQRANTELRSQNSDMQKTVTQLLTQFNSLDQSMREANLEINGLPENKNEVLSTIVTQLAGVVSYALKDCDIVKCVRVASMNKDKSRPRSVIVKLRSPRCRDELFSAITRFNKSHSDNKLNTSLLGYGGNREPVYVSEHLSPTYKSLHAAARLRAKEKSYKFVWVRYGKIFVSKNENSGTILIKDKQSLEKIV